MLVRIKVPDMDTLWPIAKLAILENTKIKENSDLSRVAAAEQFFDGTQIVFLALETDSRWYGLLSKDFESKDSHGSGSRLFATWPSTEAQLKDYQADFPVE
jgi:hypothetical protein